jgi:hypothetical protein
MSANETSLNKSKRNRSPNYPAISLAEAIPRITQIYEKEFNHAADSDTLSKALGYSGVNGASDAVISALKKYGLLENAGNREYKLSEGAIDIYLHKKGDPQRVKAIVEAAFTPPLFAELHDEHGGTPPSDNNLRVKLIKKGFNPKTVGDVIHAYRDTLELVTEETKGYNASDSSFTQKQQDQPLMQPLVQQRSASVDQAQSTPPPAEGQLHFPLYLSKGQKATLYVPAVMSKKEYELLKKQINHTYLVMEATSVVDDEKSQPEDEPESANAQAKGAE